MAETIEHESGEDAGVLTTVQRPVPLGSLTAAASRLTRRKVGDRPGLSISSEDWQSDAWDMYDLVGEFRFLATTLANRLAQARLFVGLLPDDPTEDIEPVTEGTAREVFESIGNGPHRTQAVGRLGLNLFTPGEGWLIGIPRSLRDGAREGTDRPDPVSTANGITPIGAAPEEGTADIDINDLVWHTYSVSEVSMSSTDRDHLEIRRDGRTERYRLEEVWPIRVWRPHPRYWDRADSPARSSLPVLRELVGLTMHIGAQVDSRLAGAGMFLLPQSADRAARIAAGLNEQGEEESPLAEAIMEAMLTPISDRSSAASLVPIMPVVPDESIEKFRYISFASPLDGEARALRDEAIRRLALGLDCPPELLLGVGSMNHWGAWLVKEDVVTTHIEPPLALICDALTTQFLWPVLMQQGMPEDEVRKHVIWYDVSHLIIRPNRTQDAKDLYGVGAISETALRDAAGFDESDAPDEVEKPVEEDIDPAVRMALDLVAQAPSLMQEPGLEAIVSQIRAALGDLDIGENYPTPEEEGGEAAPGALDDIEPDEGGGEGRGGGGDSGGGLPDPDETSGPPDGQDASGPLTASSGAVERLREDEETGALVTEVPDPPRPVSRTRAALPSFMNAGRGGAR